MGALVAHALAEWRRRCHQMLTAAPTSAWREAPRAGKLDVEIVDHDEIWRLPLDGGVACAMPPSRLPRSAAGERRDVARLCAARLGRHVPVGDHSVASSPPIAREQETDLFQRLFVRSNVPIRLVSIAHENHLLRAGRDAPPYAPVGRRSSGQGRERAEDHHARAARTWQARGDDHTNARRQVGQAQDGREQPAEIEVTLPPATPCDRRATRRLRAPTTTREFRFSKHAAVSAEAAFAPAADEPRSCW
jgi:hypothetical protein